MLICNKGLVTWTHPTHPPIDWGEGGGGVGEMGDANVKSEWHHMLLHNAPPCGVICSPTLHTFISPPTYSGRVQTHYQCLECVINVQYGDDRLLTLPLKLRTCVMALLFP